MIDRNEGHTEETQGAAAPTQRGEANGKTGRSVPAEDRTGPDPEKETHVTAEQLAAALDEETRRLSGDTRIGCSAAGGALLGAGVASVRRGLLGAALAAGAGAYLLYCGLTGRWRPERRAVRIRPGGAGDEAPQQEGRSGSPSDNGAADKDRVEVASEGSFPASDPPGWRR